MTSLSHFRTSSETGQASRDYSFLQTVQKKLAPLLRAQFDTVGASAATSALLAEIKAALDEMNTPLNTPLNEESELKSRAEAVMATFNTLQTPDAYDNQTLLGRFGEAVNLEPATTHAENATKQALNQTFTTLNVFARTMNELNSTRLGETPALVDGPLAARLVIAKAASPQGRA